jgi:DHA3 family macrolide efflux protein-like MFS transporter
VFYSIIFAGLKNKKGIALLLSAHVVSSSAQGITMLSIPWYFASIIDEAEMFGKVLAGATFVSMFWTVYAGTLIDRYPRKYIFLVASLVGLIGLGGAGLYGHLYQEMPIWIVAGVFVFTFFGFNIHYPNLYAFTQQMAAKGEYGKVNSIIEILGQSSNVISGAVGAVLLMGSTGEAIDFLGIQMRFPLIFEAWEIWEIFLLDAATYVVAMCIIPFITYDSTKDLPIDVDPMIQRLKTGWRFLSEHKDIRTFGIASYAIFIVLLVEVQYLLAIYVDNQLEAGADVYASSEVYFALGSLSAGFFIRKLTRTMKPITSIIVLMSMGGVVFILAAAFKSVLIFYLISAVIGFSNAGARVTRVTHLFNHIPNNIIGRANSIFYVYNIAMRGLMLMIFSTVFFDTGNNIIWAYAICGVFILMSTIPLIRMRNTVQS